MGTDTGWADCSQDGSSLLCETTEGFSGGKEVPNFFSGKQKVDISSKSVAISSFGNLLFPAIARLPPCGAVRQQGTLCPLSVTAIQLQIPVLQQG